MQRAYKRDNFTIIEVENKQQGSKAAFDLLKGICQPQSILFLSGGNSPGELYRLVATDQFRQVKPGAIATVDERWGAPGHPRSNEEMIARTGIYQHAARAGVEVHTILHGIINRQETAQRYEIVLEGLFERFFPNVALLGVGEDGHTAGLAPNVAGWQDPAFSPAYRQRLVVDFANPSEGWQHPERISLTPYALGKIETCLVLLFGKKKKSVLNRLFLQDLPVESFPLSLLKGSHGKVYLITDQTL